MATFTNSTTPINTAASQFYLWSHPISNFMNTAGWVQQNDTGQLAWPVSVFNITDALENAGGTAVTFTGTIAAGASPLVVNQSVLVSGTVAFGTVAAPKRMVVTGGNLTTTFTATFAAVANTHETPAANTAWGMVEQSMTVSSITVAASVITVTCAIISGTLRVGQSVVVAGTTAGTYDGTYTITGGNLTTTFTAATGLGNSGPTAETATASVACLPGCILASAVGTTTFPPAASSSLYEIWKMNDGHPFGVYLRFNFGTGTTTTLNLSLVLSAGTDGAGTATGGSSGTVIAFTGMAGQAAATSLMSGASNRLQLALFTSVNVVNQNHAFINIERAHDSSGVDTTTNPYATLWVVGGTAGGASASQVSIGSLNATVAETKPCFIGHHSTASGTFQVTSTVSSTLLSPAFPIVGAVGNPMIGFLLGASVDWLDTTQFSFSMYNVAHNYIVNLQTTGFPAGSATYDATPVPAIIMRYE